MSWFAGITGARDASEVRLDSRRARRLLVTGSKGKVAAMVMPLLRQHGHELRLADRLADGGERADLRDSAVCDTLVKDIEGVIHLAGASEEGAVETLLDDNAIALANILRSAVRCGVSYFIFASTMHVMGMYGRDERFDEASPPRPDSYYAVSKVCGEALCRVFFEKAGLSVTCLRLGGVAASEEHADPGAWISPEDVAQLIEIALSMARPSFEVFHAVADQKGSPLPATRAARYGYRCARPGGSYRASLRTAEAWWRGDDMAQLRRGGSFASKSLDQ